MRKIHILTALLASSIITINASTPYRKDTSLITLRNGYDQPPSGLTYITTRPATPLANSIHIDRDATIHNYSPENLVKKILLKSHSQADENRIKNVKHIGWNWDGNNWVPQYSSSNGHPYNVWGQAGTTSVTYDPQERSLAYFSNGTNAGFEIDSGLIMGTGPILMAEGTNTTNHGLSDGVKNDGRQGMHLKGQTYNTWYSLSQLQSIATAAGFTPNKHLPNTPWTPTESFDRDLDNLTQGNIMWTTCGSVLEFDFQPAVGQATFDYVWASDEYPEGIYSANDVFGFFVSGPYDTPPGDDIENTTAQFSISDPTLLTEHTRSVDDSVYYRYNIARLPDGNPVGIDYVNWGMPNTLYTTLMTTNPYVVTTAADYFQSNLDTMTLAWASSYYKSLNSTTDPTPGTSTTYGMHNGNTWYFVPTNPDLFKYNHVGSDMMEYDGYTVKLQAKADKLKPGKWYHLKLALSQTVQLDASGYVCDNNHGSGVFLANLDLGKLETDINDPYNVEDLDVYGHTNDGTPFMYTGYSNKYDLGLYAFTFKFDTVAARSQSVVNLEFVNIDPDYIVYPEITEDGDTIYKRVFPKEDTLQLSGIEDTIRIYEYLILPDYPGFVNGQEAQIILSIPGGNSDTIRYPIYNHVTWGPIQYTPLTNLYPGNLKLGLKGGSNKLMLSVDGGENYRFARDENGKELPYSEWELLQLYDNNCTPVPIILFEPDSYWKRDTIWLKTCGPATIERYIDIPQIEGMTTDPIAGKHYVEGHKDFIFTAKFNGEPLKLAAIGYYSETILNLDSIAVIQPDGSYKYTIKSVTEPWTIFVNNGNNSSPLQNEIVNSTQVWTNGNVLFVKSANPSVVTIYTLTGSIFKQLNVASESSVQLPAGFYILTINGKQYKVMIK